MTKTRWEKILLLATAAFAVFLLGFFFGRSDFAPGPGLRVYTEKEPSSALEAEPQEQPQTEPPGTEGRINLNTATLEELMTLPNIGQSRAQAILDYRQEYGDFLTVEQITEVSGVGDGILEAIRDYVTVG